MEGAGPLPLHRHHEHVTAALPAVEALLDDERIDFVQTNYSLAERQAADFDCTAWSQFFLKYIVSHPAVTCAIPATSNPNHMRENMGAARGPLPDAAMRRRMEQYVDSI